MLLLCKLRTFMDTKSMQEKLFFQKELKRIEIVLRVHIHIELSIK